MIAYRTQFPLSPDKNILDILKIGKKWIAGSPYSKLKSIIEASTDDQSDIDLPSEKETLLVRTINKLSKNEELLGIEYFVIDNNDLEWTTHIVANKSLKSFWVSIEISCESNIPARLLPRPKRPYILNYLLEIASGGKDGPFEPNGEPINLNDSDIDIAAGLINGNFNLSMPVVYISARESGHYVVNPAILAKRLYGLAHVVVEPNRQFSFRLKIDTKGQNAFSGAVGIYWPQGFGHEILFRFYEHNKFIQDIYNIISEALVVRRLRNNCSWNYFQSIVQLAKIEKLKASGDENLQEYINAFDAECKNKDQQLLEAEKEIKNLKSEIFRISNQKQTMHNGELLNYNSDDELFPNEVYDFIASLLAREHDSAMTGTRRKDVLKILCQANKPSGERDKICKQIKEALSSWDGLCSKNKQLLQNIGFELSEEGKHIKALYNGDTRYVLTLPKTPSDHRTGKNLASNANHLFF
jgi:hypothetical protein